MVGPLHNSADCVQQGAVAKLQGAVEALPRISAQLEVVANSMKEYVTLMRDNATMRADIRHLEESDKKQWQKIDTINGAPGKWLHTVLASLASGLIVGLVMAVVK